MAPPIRSQFLALIALIGIGLLVAHLIVTDAEAIRALADRTAGAAAERDMQALGEALSADFTFGSRDRAGTLEHVQGLLQKHKPTGIGVDLYELRVDDARATAKGVVSATAYGRPMRVQIDVDLVKTDDGWKLSRVRGGGYVR